MKPTQRNFVLATTVLAFLVLPVSAVEVHIEATEVHWISNSEGTWMIDVSGPGLESSQTVESGKIPAFGLFDETGQVRAEGLYTWQLIEVPSVDDVSRNFMERARFEGSEAGLEIPGPSPGRAYSGVFRVLDGVFVVPAEEEPVANLDSHGFEKLQTLSCDLVVEGNTSLEGDLFVAGSSCIGQDCDFNGGVFGFDTLQLRENNLRIKFEDTSSSASFPSNDWELTANDSANGGADRFSITDVTHGTTPFTVSGDAPNHALFVKETTGNLGLGTPNPVVELHIVDGNTPSIRLDQDASSGFTGQVWDLGGNETNFFVRDTTGSSNLPFRIRTGAPGNSLYIAADGDVHLGGQSPSAKLDVVGSAEINGDLRVSGDVYAGGVLLTSDVEQKASFEPVDREAVLEAVASLPISSWSYKDSPNVRHLGPMAQDFQAAFGLGSSQRHIAMIDAAGVSLTAVQALDQQVGELEQQVDRLHRQLVEKDTELEALQRRLAALESLGNH